MKFATYEDAKQAGYVRTNDARRILQTTTNKTHVKHMGTVIKHCAYKPQYAHSEGNYVIDISICDRNSESNYKTVSKIKSNNHFVGDIKNNINQTGAYVDLFKVSEIEQEITKANELAEQFLKGETK